MTTKKRKKGFTIVELIIVIAVIGVLAAILIPTFANVVKKANYASCESRVKDLNTVFVTETIDGNEAYAFSIDEAMELLNDAGYSDEAITKSVPGYDVVWVGQIGTKVFNRFAVITANETLSAASILYPQEVANAASTMPARWFTTSNLQVVNTDYATTTVGADPEGEENIRLAQDETLNHTLMVTGEWSLDLNGHDFTLASGSLNVSGGSLTIYDSKKAGTINLHSYSINVYNDGMLVMNGGNIVSDSAYPFYVGSYNSITQVGTPGYVMINNGSVTSSNGTNYVVYAKSAGTVFEVNGGEVNGVIGMNGQAKYAGVTVNINGGKVTAVDVPAIYFPNRDTLNITGGVIKTVLSEGATTVSDTINAKAGTINISGGSIICEAKALINIDTVAEYNNGSQDVGSALGIVTNDAYGYTTVGGIRQYAPINVTITGGMLKSLNGYALTQSLSNGSTPRTVNVNVFGGTFIGTGARGIFVDDASPEVTVIVEVPVNIER